MVRLVFVLAFVLSLFAMPTVAQMDPRANTGGTAPNVVPPRMGGPTGNERVYGDVRIGEHAPDFSLPLAGGGDYRLKQSRGRWTALFFTDRREDLPRLEGLTRTLDSLQFTTVVLLNEKAQALAQWKATSQSTLAALADDRGVIAAMYGVWDRERSTTRHGLFVLDPQGIVRLELLGQTIGAPSLRGLVQTAVEGL
jgi:peroxiredoxin